MGAGLAWHDPARGITAEVQGHSLVTYVEEEFRQQGLALSFAWDPHPSNRGPSLAVSHAVGATASGMDALLSPTVIQGLDAPAANDHLTLTPGVAVALSPDSSTYGILWSLAPYARQGQTEPWEIALEGSGKKATPQALP